MFLLFIPIGILVDVSEKVDKFKEHDLSFNQILNIIQILYGIMGIFSPIFVFLSVIWLLQNYQVIRGNCYFEFRNII